MSIITEVGPVSFPDHTGERIYMRRCVTGQLLDADIVRWQQCFDAMTKHVPKGMVCYLMVDQGEVKAGQTHRRGGVHIDGYWNPRGNGSTDWDSGSYAAPEALILASNIVGCVAYIGRWKGKIGEGGDCSSVILNGLDRVVLRAGVAYAGNVTMLHESIPVESDCLRTVVRLNVPGWNP